MNPDGSGVVLAESSCKERVRWQQEKQLQLIQEQCVNGLLVSYGNIWGRKCINRGYRGNHRQCAMSETLYMRTRVYSHKQKEFCGGWFDFCLICRREMTDIFWFSTETSNESQCRIYFFFSWVLHFPGDLVLLRDAKALLVRVAPWWKWAPVSALHINNSCLSYSLGASLHVTHRI